MSEIAITREQVTEGLRFEIALYDRIRVYKRPDGSLWCVLISVPTPVEFQQIHPEHPAFSRMKTLAKQMEAMEAYVARGSHLETLSLPLTKKKGDSQVTLGEAKRFRFKEVDGRKELHGEISLRKGTSLDDLDRLALVFRVIIVANLESGTRDPAGVPIEARLIRGMSEVERAAYAVMLHERLDV